MTRHYREGGGYSGTREAVQDHNQVEISQNQLAQWLQESCSTIVHLSNEKGYHGTDAYKKYTAVARIRELTGACPSKIKDTDNIAQEFDNAFSFLSQLIELSKHSEYSNEELTQYYRKIRKDLLVLSPSHSNVSEMSRNSRTSPRSTTSREHTRVRSEKESSPVLIAMIVVLFLIIFCRMTPLAPAFIHNLTLAENNSVCLHHKAGTHDEEAFQDWLWATNEAIAHINRARPANASDRPYRVFIGSHALSRFGCEHNVFVEPNPIIERMPNAIAHTTHLKNVSVGGDVEENGSYFTSRVPIIIDGEVIGETSRAVTTMAHELGHNELFKVSFSGFDHHKMDNTLMNSGYSRTVTYAELREIFWPNYYTNNQDIDKS